MRAEIDDLMPRRAQVRDKLLLQTKSAVIRGNANSHIFSSFPLFPFVRNPGARRASRRPQ